MDAALAAAWLIKVKARRDRRRAPPPALLD
jgi:hypothetical protein